jgi:hypothetical protein
VASASQGHGKHSCLAKLLLLKLSENSDYIHEETSLKKFIWTTFVDNVRSNGLILTDIDISMSF